MHWIDTHAHLTHSQFEVDLSEVLVRAGAANVRDIVVIGSDQASSRRAVELARTHPSLHAVVGIHPTSLREEGEGDWDVIRELSRDPVVVGLGETGLDNYWKEVPLEPQRASFLRHLEWSRETELPVVIHCREAEDDVLALLAAFAANGAPRGVMHSFTGSPATARRCLDLGLFISFAGMLTFKKNLSLREVAKLVPLERLLIETDSPYLAPEPFRGKRNEPAHVVRTGECLAAIHGLTVQDLARITTENALRLFGRIGSPAPPTG